MPISRFDYFVWGLMAVLLLAIAAVIMVGDQVGVDVALLSLGDDGTLAGRAPLVFEFGQRMQAASVEDRLVINPDVAGSFNWVNERLYYLPEGIWEADADYTVTLQAGAQSQLGHELQQDRQWILRIRQPGIAYLLDTGSLRQLWALPDLDEEPLLLSAEEQSVFDFGVAPDGEHILYSVVNDENGLDLWLVDRAGAEPRLFLYCGADRCSAPVWSPDGSQVAYSRAPAGLTPSEPIGPPRIWLLDASNGDTVRLHADNQKIGNSPSWSPDGSRLAYYDGVEGRMVVVDMESGDETYLPTLSGLVGSWSPDGGQMLYFDIESLDGRTVSVIYRADFEIQDVLPLFDPFPQDGQYSTPVWSPDGAWVAFRVKGVDGEVGAGDQIWVTPPDGRYAMVITDDENYLHTDLSWDAWGQQLLFKRIQLGVSFPGQEFWVWDAGENSLRQLLPDAVLSAWLP